MCILSKQSALLKEIYRRAVTRDRNHVTTGKEVGKNQSDFRDFVRFQLKKNITFIASTLCCIGGAWEMFLVMRIQSSVAT